jgi:hypothetical protein
MGQICSGVDLLLDLVEMILDLGWRDGAQSQADSH